MNRAQPPRRRASVRLVACSIRKIIFVIGVLVWFYLVLLWSTMKSISEATHDDGTNFGSTVLDILSGVRRTTMTSNKSTITIGVASTITSCDSDKFIEGAAVLKYSIDQTSIHGPKGGKYDYHMYILHHPDALECSLPLKDLGFELLQLPTPVNVSDIQGDFLRDRIVSNGCCGDRELIKLESFRLTQHPVVIHMDLDTIVFRPMDPAIDLMLNPEQGIEDSESVRSFVMWPERPIPSQIDLMFTKDYNLANPGRKDKPFQGGFFMVRPSLKVYHEFVQIILEGDYRNNSRHRKGSGWGGVVGPFHGGMTIQGLLPYYYEHLHPGRAVELNRCVYNNMADNPTTKEAVNDVAQGPCRTNEKVSSLFLSTAIDKNWEKRAQLNLRSFPFQTCEDCRNRNISDITTFHFTVCFKPWACFPHPTDTIEDRLCRKAHHEWFRYRHDMELSWGRNGTGPHTYRMDDFIGNCKFAFRRGYYSIQPPYGRPLN